MRDERTFQAWVHKKGVHKNWSYRLLFLTIETSIPALSKTISDIILNNIMLSLRVMYLHVGWVVSTGWLKVHNATTKLTNETDVWISLDGKEEHTLPHLLRAATTNPSITSPSPSLNPSPSPSPVPHPTPGPALALSALAALVSLQPGEPEGQGLDPGPGASRKICHCL